MKGKCVGLFRFTSKSGKPCRIATCSYDVPAEKGFGVRCEEVFLPDDTPDPILNHAYVWSYNRSGFCDMFVPA